MEPVRNFRGKSYTKECSHNSGTSTRNVRILVLPFLLAYVLVLPCNFVEKPVGSLMIRKNILHMNVSEARCDIRTTSQAHSNLSLWWVCRHKIRDQDPGYHKTIS